MSRFYFHLRSGEKVIADEEGSDLPDVAAARLEALAAARYILAEAIRSGTENIPEAFVIADSEGRELETMHLAVVLPERFKPQLSIEIVACNAKYNRREVVAADLPLFIVEMYSPGEIVDSRRSFSAKNIEAALADARPWINDSVHNATSFRVVDRDGAILLDQRVTDFN